MKLDPKSYLLNYAQYLLVVVGAVFVLGFGLGRDRGGFDFTAGYIIVSFVAIIYLGHLLAKKFSGEKK